MNRVFIIAEAGVNHNGSIEIAKKMIDAATLAGADAIKFQTFKSEELVCRDAEKAEYQKLMTKSDESQYDMLKRLELNFEQHEEIIKYCNEKGIMFLSTAFDLESIDMLKKLGIKIFKIPSGEITDYPYLRKIGRLKKKVIMSTGMCEMQEIEDALKVLKDNGTSDIAILHCNTDYPTPIQDVNLKAMNEIKERFNLKVGYSDHTLGIEVPIAAVALGAEIIEKHFTLDRNMDGPDHKASLEPDELKRMIFSIRNIEKALGNGKKVISFSEHKNIASTRKSIVAKTDIKKGQIFSERNLICKRPGIGISPMKWNEIIGIRSNKDYKKDELIKL